jgi:deazaflavin-dependent oxidoreductase (nitroreductase family)
VPSDLMLKGMNAVHRAVLKLSFGKLGWSVGSMTVVELTTTGRKSGKPHTVLLTSPLQEGNAYVVVASRGGDDHHPAWFLNLRANPEVEASIKGEARQPMTARVATAQERERLWPQVTKAASQYASYQTKTEREIPLVLIEP